MGKKYWKEDETDFDDIASDMEPGLHFEKKKYSKSLSKHCK